MITACMYTSDQFLDSMIHLFLMFVVWLPVSRITTWLVDQIPV